MSLGSSFADGLGQITNDTSIGVEQIIAGHSRLSGNTGGDDDNLSTSEGLSEFIGLVAFDLKRKRS
jgi:hypothetical protein